MSQTESSGELTFRHALDLGGAFAYENWRSCEAGVRAEEALEYPLYSDAPIAG